MTKLAFKIAILAPAMVLGGCASTYNFAPPFVEMHKAASDTQRNCLGGSGNTDIARNTVEGAIVLADNFTTAYRCAARNLANGRQHFEVPSALTLVGGATAAALGAGPTTAIATGATAGLFDKGKDYYDPAGRFQSIQDAQEAAVCVHAVATGGTGLKIEKRADQAQNPKEELDLVANETTEKDAQLLGHNSAATLVDHRINRVQAKASREQTRFYGEIYSALMKIDSILAGRLANAGTINIDQLIVDLRKLAEDSGEDESNDQKFMNATGYDEFMAQDIDFDELRLELLKCVVQASA